MQSFVWPIRIYYEDTDAGGLVYHANYLKFMERARSEWLRSLGYEQDTLIKQQGILFAVRSAALDYYKPALFNDLLHAGVSVRQLRHASITFEQLITRCLGSGAPGSEEVLTRAVIKVASLDATSFKPKPIPQTIRQDLERAN